MGKKTHTRESIIQTLQSLAQRLGKDSLSIADLQGLISPSSINGYFGSLGNALEAAGLRKKDKAEHLSNRRPKFSDPELFQALLDLEREIGHEPGYNEFHAKGKFSVKPFRSRFHTWDNALAFYRKWKIESGVAQSNGKDVMPSPSGEHRLATADKQIATAITLRPPTQLYGEPIDFRGLRHAPINEQGVVYLFGMVSRELGFYIESVQVGFPDCEGKYLYDRKRNLWAKARIEFEFRAANFRQHGHDPNRCDFVVCWEDDWPDCPITVIELRREILKLPSR